VPGVTRDVLRVTMAVLRVTIRSSPDALGVTFRTEPGTSARLGESEVGAPLQTVRAAPRGEPPSTASVDGRVSRPAYSGGVELNSTLK
jgi:hypothetical protein